MFQERDKWLFKIVAVLALTALMVGIFTGLTTMIKLLTIPAGIMIGWAIIVVLEK